jgi:AraC family transcriptional regulator, regulatory protein of adaptative response / methylated-DNA-[protein]-cysteine methyltransferase
MPSLPPIDEMERAFRSRDSAYDGIFFVGVRTTGVFCRPVCPARKPLTRNVVYFATPRDAIVAGYRPCKRCHPLNIQGTPPEWIQQLVLEIERDPTTRIADTDLRIRGINPARVRRYFLKHYGMTFHAYCCGRRMGQALAQIRAGINLDEVALGNGYESHSGFRDAFTKTFGQSPGKVRRSIS